MFHRTTAQASAPVGQASVEIASPLASKLEGRSGHPKMLPPAPGINAARAELIDINAIDETDPVHFRSWHKPTDDEFDDNQFSIENGDGSIY